MAADRPTLDAVDWPEVLDALTLRPHEQLDTTELTRLADAQFWCDHLQDSITTRHAAYDRHVAAGDHADAALACWRIFYEHFLVGEEAPASGWLERCRRHSADAADPIVDGWLLIADGDVAARRGELDRAIDSATAAVAAGRAHRRADLIAMGLQLEGRVRIDAGERLAGLVLLDEAMVAVINDELPPLFTGWVYCNVISTCYHAADLRRATEWSDAAERWCATLRDGRLYRGLCRVYAAELATLNGDWPRACEQADLACDELIAHDPRYAGAAFYLAGELRRRLGDRAGSTAAFERARSLGHPTQPGHAMALAERGRVDDAISSLRTALHPAPGAPLPHAQLLGSLVAVAAGRRPAAEFDDAVDALTSLAAQHDATILDAYADVASARRALADHDIAGAIAAARTATEHLDRLGCRYDAADARCVLAAAAERGGDVETARHELEAAIDAFERIGARPAAAEAAGHLRRLDGGRRVSPLSTRETDVLTLVAQGKTNRQIADELHLSPHTVARHVSNIRTKLDAPTRTAAATRGAELGIV